MWNHRENGNQLTKLVVKIGNKNEVEIRSGNSK